MHYNANRLQCQKKKWRKIQIQKRILRWQPFWKEKEPQADERSLLECASNMLWPSKQGHFAWTLINITNQYSVPGKCLSTIYDYICTLYHWFQQYYQWHYQQLYEEELQRLDHGILSLIQAFYLSHPMCEVYCMSHASCFWIGAMQEFVLIIQLHWFSSNISLTHIFPVSLIIHLIKCHCKQSSFFNRILFIRYFVEFSHPMREVYRMSHASCFWIGAMQEFVLIIQLHWFFEQHFVDTHFPVSLIIYLIKCHCEQPSFLTGFLL